MFTLDDLYQFFVKQNQTCVFNSKESDSTIIVQILEKMNFSDEYNPNFNQLPVHLMACHLMENNNRSSISEKAMKEAIPSFYNRPILGYIQEIENEDGSISYDFAGHEMNMDSEGNIEYEEKIVGVIPESCNPQLVYHEEHDKTYLEVDGIIYEDYTKAATILRDKGNCDVSIEISVNSLSFDANTKIMNIDSFCFLGVTILGVTTDDDHQKIMPGMAGSNITISDFSAENNSFVFNKQDVVEEIIAEVIHRLDYIKADSAEETREGGYKAVDKENVNVEFEETETEDTEVKTTDVEEVKVEETTEEETPVVETEASKEEVVEEPEETPEVVDDFADEGPVADDDSEETEEEHQSVSAIEDEDSTGTRVENSLEYSVTIDGVKKNFAVSLADKINAVTTLVNDTYSESDNAWYYCDVYEDDGKYCIMHDFWNDRHFKQEFSVKKDVYSLKGDRVPVYVQYLTSDQIAQLDKMKSDYSAIESELNTYKAKELHAAREAVLSSDDYAVIADYAEFEKLVENMDNYSVEELTKEADLLYAKFMKSNYSTFADNKPKSHTVFMSSGNNVEEERLPYGGLFKNFKNKK